MIDRYTDNCITCLIYPATKEEKEQHGSDATWIPVFDKTPRPLPKDEVSE